MCSIPSYFDCIYKLHDLSLKSLDGATKKGGRNRRRQHWAPYFFSPKKYFFLYFFLETLLWLEKFSSELLDWLSWYFLFHFRTVGVWQFFFRSEVDGNRLVNLMSTFYDWVILIGIGKTEYKVFKKSLIHLNITGGIRNQ